MIAWRAAAARQIFESIPINKGNNDMQLKKRIRALALTGVLALIQPLAAGAGEKIVLADLTWDEPRAVNAVLAEILTNTYGAEVSLIAADQTAIFAAMGKGDGSVDVHPAVWSGAQQSNIDRFVTSEGKVRLNAKPYDATDGFYVPKFFAEQHGIKSIEDLKKPEIAALFDINGDGRGDYWPGAPGWGVTNIYRVKGVSYGLEEFYDPIVASDALMKTQLASVEAKKTNGLLFYYWKPEALHQAYELTQLEEPAFDGFAMESKKATPEYKADGCYNYVDPKESPDWLKQSRITCATPPQPIYIAYSSSLEERAPEIAAFLNKVAIEPSEVGAWIYAMTIDKKDPATVAKEWVSANPERVKSWTGK
ncbi:glycine betaine ABC transporter substrate-binding protein [Shinella sp. M27]|uniref:ABC transporter substrate-binding protein n=1 Tax=Shinella sp. M27 TaxID=3368614 RepID=UPI003B9EECEE